MAQEGEGHVKNNQGMLEKENVHKGGEQGLKR